MTDNAHTSSRETDSAKIIDMDVKEVHISNEELAQNYVDVKQAGQLLNNASERTFYRLLNEVKEKFKFEPAKVSVSQNGVRKNLYLKSDILKMADLLNKQPAVIAYRTEFRTADSGTTDSQTVNKSEQQHTAGRESDSAEEQGTGLEISNTSKLAIIEGLKSISEFRGDLRELNGNVRELNTMMHSTITKVIEQGIDLKERYLKDREDRTTIERQQAETSAKQSQALMELTKKMGQQKPENNSNNLIVLSIVLIALFGAGWGAFYFFTTNQQKMESRFEEKLSQDRQIQQDQFQQTIKQLKESLTPVTTNAAVPAGQGK